MRITESQLRRIIRQEVQALREGGDDQSSPASGELAGQSKAQGLSEALDHVTKALDHVGAAIEALQLVAKVARASPQGEDPKVLSATLDLMEVQFSLRKIAERALGGPPATYG